MQLHNEWEYKIFNNEMTYELFEKYPDGAFFYITKNDEFFKVKPVHHTMKCLKGGWSHLINSGTIYDRKDFEFQKIKVHEFGRKKKHNHSLVYLSFGEDVGEPSYRKPFFDKIYFAPYGFVICESS